MAERKVVKRSRGTTRQISKDFALTREMMPFNSGNGSYPTFLKDYRLQAWDSYEKLAMPSTQDEPWRRTDIRALEAGGFRLPKDREFKSLPKPPKKLLEPLVGKVHGGQIILLAGGIERAELRSSIAAKGVIFTDLSNAEVQYPDILQKIIGQVVRPEEGRFASIASAFAQNGVLVYVPQGVQVEEPLHSVLWGPGSGLAYFSHILVYLEEGSSLTYVHEAASPTEKSGQTMHSGIVEIVVGAGANLRFVELQSWGEHVWNFSHERAIVKKDGNLDWIFGAVGSHLTKNFSDLDLSGEGAAGRMSGFYFTDGVQHLDHDTQQNHLAPNTTSDLLFKGALKDRSRSVWQGMIYVAPGAQKTDGYQANRNLNLSPHSRADSIPGLEILADDVRCTHGATIGKIDPDLLFYLRSRGLPLEEAERLIVGGFFDPIMQRIPFEGVRSRLQDGIREKLE